MKQIPSIYALIASAIKSLLNVAFGADADVMSDEVKKIMSNPEDRVKFIDAVEKLKNKGSKEETIKLSDNSSLTLVP